MRYLKVYEEYNTPDNFIKLLSFDLNYEDEDELNMGDVSDEDKKLMNKYWLNCKPFIEGKINWDLIQMAKDASLDYLDENFKLVIDVFILSESKEKIIIYSDVFSHDYTHNEFKKFFTNAMEIVKKGNLYYRFRLEPIIGNKQYGLIYFEPSKSNDLISLLKDMFPNEDEKIIRV